MSTNPLPSYCGHSLEHLLQYSTSNPFSIHRLLPGPGSPMHPSLSKAELHYNDYALQNHTLHHDSMYYNPPVYQVCSICIE